MTYTLEVEKDGRISLPDGLRDSLHLEPGSRLSVEDHPVEGLLTMRIQQAPEKHGRLFYEDGVLVYDAPGADTSFDIVAAIAEMRGQRMRDVMQVSLGEDVEDAA